MSVCLSSFLELGNGTASYSDSEDGNCGPNSLSNSTETKRNITSSFWCL